MSQATKGGHKSTIETEVIRVGHYGSFVACRGIRAADVAGFLKAHAELRGGPRCMKLKEETMVTRVPAGTRWRDLGLTSSPDVVVKQAPVPPRRCWFYRLGGTSPLQRSFGIHPALARRDVISPRPFVCSLRPSIAFEFAISEYLKGKTLREFLWLGDALADPERWRLDPQPSCPDPHRARLLQALGVWLRRLHDAGVWQRDLKSENVIVRGGETMTEPVQFHLLDIAAVRFLSAPLKRKRCVRNLGQVLDLPRALDPVAAGAVLGGYLRGDPTGHWERDVCTAVRERRERRARRTGYRYVDEEYFGTKGPETI